MCGLHPLPSLGPAGDSCELAKREASTSRQPPAMRLRHIDGGDAGTMQFQQPPPAIGISSEVCLRARSGVDTGSHKENTSTQESKARVRFNRNRKGFRL